MYGRSSTGGGQPGGCKAYDHLVCGEKVRKGRRLGRKIRLERLMERHWTGPGRKARLFDASSESESEQNSRETTDYICC